MNQLTSHKTIVHNFYSKVLAMGDAQLANTLIQDNYVQHSPLVETGKSGFLKFLEMLKKLPQPSEPSVPFFRTIAQGNLVAVHIGIEFMGQQKAVVDLFRIEDGQLAEHWDASEDVPDARCNPLPMVEGPVCIEDQDLTDSNARIVRSFTEKVLIAGEDLWLQYMSPDLIQHHPDLSNGISSLPDYSMECKTNSLHQVIAEGNFVVTQAQATIQHRDFVLYNVYRLHEGVIVEHWSVKQPIPTEMAHSNGMI